MSHVDIAAARAHRDPSDEQKLAGNYRKGHCVVHGLEITIENAKGSVRSGKDGKKWKVTMPSHYGYIKGTEGADGDQVDVYIGPSPRSDRVFLIDQVDATSGTFDEHKAMLGFVSKQHAISTYHRAFSDGKGPDRIGHVTALSIGAFKKWLAKGDTTQPKKLLPHFEDGGAMPEPEEDDSLTTGATDTEPPGFAAWLAKQQQTQTPAPGEAEPPGFDAWLAQMQDDAPTPETPLATGVREAAHAVVPAAAGLAGIGPGAAAGALAGAPLAPVTAGFSVPVLSFAGGILGALGAGYLASTVQEHVLSMLGLDDSSQRQANEEANPTSAFVGGLLPNVAGFAPGKSAMLAARGLNAGVQAGLEGVQEKMRGDDLDPVKLGLSAAAGVALPAANKLGAKIMGTGERIAGRFTAGRPDVKGDPVGEHEQQEAATSEPTKNVVGAAQEQPAVTPDPDAVGSGQFGSVGDFGRDGRKPSEQARPDAMSTGEIPDDIALALMHTDVEAAKQPEPTPFEQAQQAGMLPGAQPAPPAPVGGNVMGRALPGEAPPAPGTAMQFADSQGKVRDAARRTPSAEFSIPGEQQAQQAAPESPQPAREASPVEAAADPAHAEVPDVNVVTDKHVPYLAGSSNDGRTVYIDPSVPETMNVNGKIINPREVLAAHEIYERRAIAELQKAIAEGRHPPMSDDQIYAVSHQKAGTAAERSLLSEKYGFNEADFQEYQRQMRNMEHSAEHGAAAHGETPEDLYTFMYPHEQATHEDGVPSPSHVPTAAEAVPAHTAEPVPERKPSLLDQVKQMGVEVPPEGVVAPEKPKGPPKKDTRTQHGERFKVPENNTTAGSEAEANRRSRSFQAAQSAFEKFAPEEGAPMPTTPAQREAFKARLKTAIDHAQDAFRELGEANGHPLHYTPRRDTSTAALNWLRDARAVVNGKMPIADFLPNELLYRHGNADDTKLARDTKGIRAAMSKSRRGGDVAEQAGDRLAAADFPTEHAADDILNEDLRRQAQEAGPHIDELLPADMDITHATPAQLDEIANKLLGLGEKEVDPSRITPPPMERDSIRSKLGGADAANEGTVRYKGKISPEEQEKYKAMMEAQTRRNTVANKIMDFARDEAGGTPMPKAVTGSVAWLKGQAKWLASTKPAKVYSGSAFPLHTSAPHGPPMKKWFTAHQPEGAGEINAYKQWDELHRMTQEHYSDKISLVMEAEKQPRATMLRKPQEDVYRALETGSVASLPQRLQDHVNNFIKPMRDEIEQLYNNLRKWDPQLPAFDPNHIYRMAKGYTKDFEPGKHETPFDVMKRSLSTDTSTLEDRTFMAIERQDGKRFIVSQAAGPKGEKFFTLWDKGAHKLIKKELDLSKPGGTLRSGKDTFTAKDALTDEIEGNARFKNGQMAQYYKNATGSVIKQLAQLRDVARHVAYVESAKTNPSMLLHMTNDARAIPEGWAQSDMKQFKGWYMDPPLKAVFDDYVKPGLGDLGGGRAGASLDNVRRLSSGIVKTMFWNPVPHVLNVFWHWWVGRGWDWINPAAYHSLAVTGADAMKSVMSHDAFQIELARHFGGGILPGVLAGEFGQNLARAVDIDIQRNPPKWDLIAKSLGKGPSDLAAMIWKGANKVMWAANDVLYTQAVKDVMRRKGMGMADAIVHVERHFPNYRVPAQIMGSRLAAKFVQDQLVVSFGRYHYGMMNSLATVAKDLTGAGPEGSMKETTDALGNVFALGLLAMVAKPLLDAGAQAITGNKDAQANLRGPLAPLTHAARALTGKEGYQTTVGSMLSLSPLMNTAIDVADKNKDFRGKDIVKQGDLGGRTPGHVGRAVLQAAEYTGRQLVQPFGMTESIMDAGVNPAKGIAESLLDIKEPSKGKAKYDRTYQQKNEREVRQDKKSSGPIGRLYDHFVKR